MNDIPEYHRKVTERIMPKLLNISKAKHGFKVPANQIVSVRALIGSAFTIGVAFGQTGPDKPWLERLDDAYRIIEGGNFDGKDLS